VKLEVRGLLEPGTHPALLKFRHEPLNINLSAGFPNEACLPLAAAVRLLVMCRYG